jgi:hypothetical protein
VLLAGTFIRCVPPSSVPIAVSSMLEQLLQGEANRVGSHMGLGVSRWQDLMLLHGPVTAEERVSRPRPEHVNPFAACLLHPPQLFR